MFVKIEDLTPKKIINFYLPHKLELATESLVVNKSEQIANILLKNIFSITGITRILLTSQLLSVSYDGAVKDDVRAYILAELDDFFVEGFSSSVSDISNVTLIEQAESLADALIRPTLNRDKGDIEILSLKDGVLKLKFLGHCAGCPYAQNTLQNVIAKTLLRYLPQISEITLEECQ